MKKNLFYPDDQVFWYLKRKKPNQLKENIKTNIVVIGGGMAGLSTAQSFADKGYKVSLVEKFYCGAGASGKSSGFVTPDAEFDLNQLSKLFNVTDAKKLWDFANFGVEFIRNNINKFSIDCDYKIEDTLIVANNNRLFKELKKEHAIHQKLSYKSTLYNKKELPQILCSNDYAGGIHFSGSFGINSYLYCQAMKENLENLGVKIYEETPAIRINLNGIDTPHGSITAEYIIICVDRFLIDLGKLVDDVFQAQTFLLISEPLNEKDIKKIFPDKNLMVWDNDIIYQYYRIVSDNRFMIGGSDLIAISSSKEQHNLNRMFKKLYKYAKKKFPHVTINFKYFWPGLIGTSKDIMPIAGLDCDQPNIYYISCATGLNWAAALGSYCANKIIDNKSDFDSYFSQNRKFPVGKILQHFLGKRIIFSLSNLKTILKA